jgi:hypothetical protein
MSLPISTTLPFSTNLRGGHRPSRLAKAGDDLGAADGAHAALAQPRVHARSVQPMLATRHHPAPVARLERLQAHRAVAGDRAGLTELVAVARQLAELLGRQPLRRLSAELLVSRRRA